MKIRINEQADSHGSRITHFLDMKEGLDKIEFSALDHEVKISFTTRMEPEVLKVGYLDSIWIESYSV